MTKVNATKKFKFWRFAYSKGRTVYTSASESSAEGKEQAEETDEAKPKSEHQAGHEGSNAVQDGLDELLRDSVYEAEDAGMEWEDEWLRHRIQAYIWKKPRIKLRNMMELGVLEYFARMAANSRRSYWLTVETGVVKRAITNERLARAGDFELSPGYESIRAACIGSAVYRMVHTVR